MKAMTLDRTHTTSHFTPAELQELLKQQRVLFEVGLDSEYRYIVPVDTLGEISRWEMFDAWRINAAGEKDPEMLCPSPVAKRDLVDIDFSPLEFRRPITDFARGRMQTFVFGLGGVESSSDAFHVRALGVGVTEATAARDAVARLIARYPGLQATKNRSSTGLEHQFLLLDALRHGGAVVHSMVAGGYPRPEQMGHDYMSNETHQLASALHSMSEVAGLVASRPDSTVAGARIAIDRHARKLIISMGLNKDLIDWSEVVSGFPQEVASEATQYSAIPRASFRAEPEPVAAAPAKSRRIDSDVLDVLRQSVVTGQELRLPSYRLDPQLYRRVNEVLVSLGGKWVGRKIQAHIFEEDAAPQIEVALATGSFIHPKDFGFFPTPTNLVEQLIELAEIEPGMLTLEPSAGHGAIAIQLAAAAGGLENVTVCEFLPRNAARLKDLGFTQVVHGDFLSMKPEPVFDRVVMNPPFSGGADIEHVMHATRFLKPDGRLVAITSPAWTSHQNLKSEAFRSFVDEVGAEVSSIERGAFRESGTDIETRIVALDAANLPWNREVHQMRERVRG